MKKLSTILLLLQIIGIWLLLPGCGPAAPPPAPVATTPAPVHLKAGTLPFISNAILKIAVEEGYFSEQGLDVELVPFKSSNDLIPLLLKGDLDVATPALTAGLFNAMASGSTLKIVLPLTDFKVQDCTAIAFLARKADVEGQVYADIAHWKGANLALTSGNALSTSSYLLNLVMRQEQLSDTDVRLESIDLAAQAEALRTRQVDIVYAVEPWVTRLQAAGDIAILMPAEPLAPGLTSSEIVFGSRLLANPETGNRFATAYLKAVRQYLQGKTPRNVELIAAYTGLEPALVRQVCWSHSPAGGQINVESILAYQAWLKEKGALDRILQADEFLDTRFAQAANQALGNSAP